MEIQGKGRAVKGRDGKERTVKGSKKREKQGKEKK